MFDPLATPSSKKLVNTQKPKRKKVQGQEISVDPLLNIIERIAKAEKKVEHLTNAAKNNPRASPTYTMSKTGKQALISPRAAPAARGARVRGANKPNFTSSKKGIIVKHKEMIGSLISSSTTLGFAATSFVVNPGRPAGFPWLSTIACNFDKYVMRELTVYLVSSQPTSVAGRIGVGIDYDSTDVLPGDRVDFFNLTHHAECPAWDSVKLVVPMKPVEKFVNSHTLTDSKLIDMGQIVVMADQIVATSATIADIIVEYHVELLEPQQAVMFTGSFTGVNVSAFSSMAVTGPNIASLITTTSTTVAEWYLPQGCYLVNTVVVDTGAGSPTAGGSVHGGTGRGTGTASTTGYSLIAVVKITSNDGTYRTTLAGVALVNLELISVTFTRISPPVFTILGGVNGVLSSALTTY